MCPKIKAPKTKGKLPASSSPLLPLSLNQRGGRFPFSEVLSEGRGWEEGGEGLNLKFCKQCVAHRESSNKLELNEKILINAAGLRVNKIGTL